MKILPSYSIRKTSLYRNAKTSPLPHTTTKLLKQTQSKNWIADSGLSARRKKMPEPKRILQYARDWHFCSNDAIEPLSAIQSGLDY